MRRVFEERTTGIIETTGSTRITIPVAMARPPTSTPNGLSIGSGKYDATVLTLCSAQPGAADEPGLVQTASTMLEPFC